MATFTKRYDFNIAEACPEFPFAGAYTRIMELLDNENEVKKHLLVLDSMIQKAYADNVKKDKDYSKAQALYDILRESEALHKFDTKKVYYITGVIKSAAQFYKIMEDKAAFLDPFVTKNHGAETHRIQWWIIGRDMVGKEKTYGAKVSSDIFQAAADKRGHGKGTANVWYNALDADQGKCNTGRAPESLKEYINAKFPNIAEAESQQMQWDSAVKMVHDKKVKLGAVKAKMEANFDLKKYP